MIARSSAFESVCAPFSKSFSRGRSDSGHSLIGCAIAPAHTIVAHSQSSSSGLDRDGLFRFDPSTVRTELIGARCAHTQEMRSMIPWVKIVHLLGLILWMGGFLVLTQILRRHLEEVVQVQERLVLIEQQIAQTMNIGAGLTLATGILIVLLSPAVHPAWEDAAEDENDPPEPLTGECGGVWHALWSRRAAADCSSHPGTGEAVLSHNLRQ